MSRRAAVEAFAESEEKTVATMMAGYALDAADHAAALGHDLDFSEASLRNVEAVLDLLHREMPRGLSKLFKRSPDQATIATFAKMYGGYIGEVMRFEWRKGEWDIPADGPFAQSLCLVLGPADMISPPGKAYKRIVDGPQDNIWSYYDIIKMDIMEQQQ